MPNGSESKAANAQAGRMQTMLEVVATQGATQAASGFAHMVGKALTVSVPRARWTAPEKVPELLGGPEETAVGIYLRSHGEMSGQILLVLALPMALELVDLMLENPSGTTTTFGPLERSALGELGNLTGAAFLNAVAAFTGMGGRLSPPAVVIDMLGAILDIVAASHEDSGDAMLILQMAFVGHHRAVHANFWVIPDAAALAQVARRILRND